MRRLQRTVPILADRPLDHLAEGARLQFVVEQLLQQFQSEVALGELTHLLQELVGEERDVRVLEARRGEDIDQCFSLAPVALEVTLASHHIAQTTTHALALASGARRHAVGRANVIVRRSDHATVTSGARRSVSLSSG